uniref:Uncharacterized protein n=1 Tax=Arundo donax TaxID=35708 RepID=A0A0A9AED4_ARUDO
MATESTMVTSAASRCMACMVIAAAL